jgi:hypothetical protein
MALKAPKTTATNHKPKNTIPIVAITVISSMTSIAAKTTVTISTK